MLSRRELIGKAAVGAAATVAVSAAGVASARVFRAGTDGADGGDRAPTEAHANEGDGRNALGPVADELATALPPPWELVHPLVAGSTVGHGWRLVGLGPVQHGSCVATLQNARGRSHRVHLCRNDGSPQGLVYTRRVDLVVMNEGQGDLPTEEGLAQAVAALAHAVAGNEARMPGSLLAELLPHAERLRQFAAADDPSAGGRLR